MQGTDDEGNSEESRSGSEEVSGVQDEDVSDEEEDDAVKEKPSKRRKVAGSVVDDQFFKLSEVRKSPRFRSA